MFYKTSEIKTTEREKEREVETGEHINKKKKKSKREERKRERRKEKDKREREREERKTKKERKRRREREREATHYPSIQGCFNSSCASGRCSLFLFKHNNIKSLHSCDNSSGITGSLSELPITKHAEI